MNKGLKRCSWANNEPLLTYHDEEWGVPQHNDVILFEFLILEGAQAGLSWEIVLKRRSSYRRLFSNFNPRKVAKFTSRDVSKLMKDPSIIRNRLKIKSAIANAQAFLKIQKEFGSFDKYLWEFVAGKPQQNSGRSRTVRSITSDALSKDLKKRGFSFVGTTITYAFMQAVGMINDHNHDCYRKKKLTAT